MNIDLDKTSSLKIKYRQKLFENIIENQITSITINKSTLPYFDPQNITSNQFLYGEDNVNLENHWINNFTKEEISELDMIFDMNFYIPPKKRYPVKIKITSRKKSTPPDISLEDI